MTHFIVTYFFIFSTAKDYERSKAPRGLGAASIVRSIRAAEWCGTVFFVGHGVQIDGVALNLVVRAFVNTPENLDRNGAAMHHRARFDGAR
jgi:hypothetical protein